jgi:hypothetical protein
MSSIGTKLDGNQVLKESYDDSSKRIRVDAAVTASLGEVVIKDPAGDLLNVNTDGSLNVNLINPISIEVDAADGDNISIKDVTGTNSLDVNIDGSINITDNGSSLTVDAVDLDIRNLSSSTDSVSSLIKDSSGNNLTSLGGALDVNIASGIGIKTGGLQGNLSLTLANTAYEVKIGGSPLTNRSIVTVMPTDGDMYWGYDNTVTNTTGTPLFKNQFITFELDRSNTAKIFLYSTMATKNARITESA